MTDNKSRNVSPENTELAVSTVTALTGGVMALFPELQVVGTLLGGFSGLLGSAAGRLHAGKTELRAERVEEVADDLRDRLEQEELTDQREAIKDLVIEAIPIIEDAETHEKRRLIADIILNAARRGGGDVARAEALHALRLIKEMSAAAVIVFAEVARVLRGASEDRQIDLPENAGYAALSPSVAQDAFVNLRDLRLIAYQKPGSSRPWVMLTTQGTWLRDWILQSPASTGSPRQP